MAAASPVSSNTLLCVVNRVCGILSLGIDCFCLHASFPLAYVLDPSHALIQVLLAVNDIGHGEAVVQPGRYRYLAFVDGATTVKFVLSEYLACAVVWAW